MLAATLTTKSPLWPLLLEALWPLLLEALLWLSLLLLALLWLALLWLEALWPLLLTLLLLEVGRAAHTALPSHHTRGTKPTPYE
jgi:hypothetical protein